MGLQPVETLSALYLFRVPIGDVHHLARSIGNHVARKAAPLPGGDQARWRGILEPEDHANPDASSPPSTWHGLLHLPDSPCLVFLLLTGDRTNRAGKGPPKLCSFFYGEQDRLGMQGTLRGGNVVRHKEMSIIADVFLDIADVCFLSRQMNRDDRTCWFQVHDGFGGHGQANLSSSHRAGGDHAGCAPQQRWKGEGIERTPCIEHLLTQVKLVRSGHERQAMAQDVALLIYADVR